MTERIERERYTNAGYEAVLAWNRRIHTRGTTRYDWALECAELLREHGAGVELPPYPSQLKTTQASRDETIRRVFRRNGGQL